MIKQQNFSKIQGRMTLFGAVTFACLGTALAVLRCGSAEVKQYNGPKLSLAVLAVEAIGHGQPGTKEQLEKLLIPSAEASLFKTNRFDVINRDKLSTLLAEQSLNLSGIIRSNDYSQLNQIGGVQAAVLITATGGENRSLLMQLRLLDTSTARMLAVSDCKAEPVENYQQAMNNCAVSLANSMTPD